MHYLRYVALLLVWLSAISTSEAVVVFDGGPADVANGQALFWDMADDFQVNSAAKINGATVPILAILGGRNLATWDGTMHWAVYAAGPALLNPNGSTLSTTTPGAVIAQGSALNIQTTFLSESPGPFGDPYQYYTFNFDFGQEISLGANTRYWFGLHMNQSYNQAFLYWQQTNTHLFDHNFGRPNPQSAYGYQGSWVPFALNYNVPEPTSLGLLALPVMFLARRWRRTIAPLVAAVVLIAIVPPANAGVLVQSGFESAEGYTVGTQLGTHAPWFGNTPGWTISSNTIAGSGAKAGSQWVQLDPLTTSLSATLQTVNTPVTDFSSQSIVTASCSTKIVSPAGGTIDRGAFVGLNVFDENALGQAELDFAYDVQNTYGFGANHWVLLQFFGDFSFFKVDLGTTSRLDQYVDLAIGINFSTDVVTMYFNGSPLAHTGVSLMPDFHDVSIYLGNTTPTAGGIRPRAGFDNFSVVQSAVPEPSMLGLFGMIACPVLSRRFRKL